MQREKSVNYGELINENSRVSEAIIRTKATKMEDYFVREGMEKKLPEVVMERDKRVPKAGQDELGDEPGPVVQVRGTHHLRAHQEAAWTWKARCSS